MSLGLRVISNITKVYPDMIHIVIYKEPKVFYSNRYPKRDRNEVSDYYKPCVSSLNRTKTLVKDLVLCNDFELFCTFTFDPNKVDSFSYPQCKRVMTLWLHHQSDKAREQGKQFKYLIIPEKHKSGRYHFHALISGYSSTLKDSGHISKSLRPVYNITSFRSGFTTAVYIDSAEGVSNYVTKYITKDFIREFNRRRFLSSRNLNRPARELNSNLFSRILPLFRRKVSENSETLTFSVDRNNVMCNTDDVGRNVVQCIHNDTTHY